MGAIRTKNCGISRGTTLMSRRYLHWLLLHYFLHHLSYSPRGLHLPVWSIPIHIYLSTALLEEENRMLRIDYNTHIIASLGVKDDSSQPSFLLREIFEVSRRRECRQTIYWIQVAWCIKLLLQFSDAGENSGHQAERNVCHWQRRVTPERNARSRARRGKASCSNRGCHRTKSWTGVWMPPTQVHKWWCWCPGHRRDGKIGKL